MRCMAEAKAAAASDPLIAADDLVLVETDMNMTLSLLLNSL